MKNVINRALVAKKRNILTLVLAIVSSVWMMSEAMCLGSIPDAMLQPYTTVSGTIQALPLPCEPGEDCPTCLTEAIVTNDKTYYLTTKNQQVADFLEQIQTSTVPAIYLLPLKATASGTPYQMGSFDYLLISSLNELSVEYFSDQQENKLPSLCDEWNVLEISNVTCGYCEEYRTYNFHLTTDTVIGGLLYSQLIKDGAYKGALREGNNRDIYCVPAGCSQEYLLYAFNAQVGDSLKNIWVGGNSSWIPDVRSAIVSEIKQTTPRTIELEVHYYEAPDAYEESIRNLTWIEGIGMPFGPMGAECSVFNGCADSKAKLLLCAYKNGEQVYTSAMGEQYGCEYNYNPNTNHTDTIPMYSRDDSGSSTVDPVDPNQIYATLTGDVLTVHNNTGAQVTFTVNNISVKNVAARVRSNVEPVSFTESISVELSEDGIYEILLTSEEWNYTVFGTVNYIRSGTDVIKEDTTSATKKVLRGTQILIEREGKTYTLTGQEIN